MIKMCDKSRGASVPISHDIGTLIRYYKFTRCLLVITVVKQRLRVFVLFFIIINIISLKIPSKKRLYKICFYYLIFISEFSASKSCPWFEARI